MRNAYSPIEKEQNLKEEKLFLMQEKTCDCESCDDQFLTIEFPSHSRKLGDGHIIAIMQFLHICGFFW